MRFQEVKYKVDSLNLIQEKLKAFGAKPIETVTSLHYYAKQSGNDTVKLVKYGDKSEIRILERKGDKSFRLKENITVADESEGFKWLKKQGFNEVEIVKMTNTDYEYKNGIVGLYIINDFLLSAILDFPGQDYKPVEKELGLASAERIETFYNKFLAQMGKLESVSL